MQLEAENISESQSNVLGENQAISQDVRLFFDHPVVPNTLVDRLLAPGSRLRETGATAPWAPAGIVAGVLGAPSVSAEQQVKALEAGE